MEESKAIVLSYETGLVPASKKQVVMGVVKQYLDEFDIELPERIAESSALVIKNQADREFATTKRQEAAAALDDIAEKRKALLGPPKKDIVDIEAMFNKITKQITTIKENYNTEIGRDFMEQKRITAEAEARLRQEAEKQRLQAQEAIISQAIDQNDEGLLAEADNVFVPDIKLAEPERTTRTDFGSTNVRTEYAVECTDKMALIRHIAQSSLFSGYLEVDLAYAKRDINKNNWKDIPGLKITEVPKVGGRSK
jgi:hypothetical protein